MPKRSLSTFVDSDSESSYDTEVLDSYSDGASKKKISFSKSRSKKRIRKVHASSSSVTHEISLDSPPHSSSSHTIESSVPIRLALLEWYKTVHDIRGMPWRKSYDPTQGPNERAQRAYEVLFFHWIHERRRDYLQFKRFGFLRLCCSRLKLQPWFHTTSDGWRSMKLLLLSRIVQPNFFKRFPTIQHLVGVEQVHHCQELMTNHGLLGRSIYWPSQCPLERSWVLQSSQSIISRSPKSCGRIWR